MKSAPPKQVEQPIANADPRNIAFKPSSNPDPLRRVAKPGRRQRPGAPELAPTQMPSMRMPSPAAMPSGRFHDSITSDVWNFSPANPAREPAAVKTIVNPATK